MPPATVIQRKPPNHTPSTGKTQQPNKVEPANDTKMPLYGSCNLCCMSSTMRCERCGDFYCNESCQIQHWPQHKSNCFAMPKLIQAAEMARLLGAQMKTSSLPEIPNPMPEKSSGEIKGLLPVTSVYKAPTQNQKKNNTSLVLCEAPLNGSEVTITWFASTNCAFVVGMKKGR